MTELRDHLQTTLGATYRIERELGGGGMARVFVATEMRLRRPVVVKVLPPDMAADLSIERFEREIHLAASLQQANIVPVLTAGDMDGVPYYTMPYVEGESLRALVATHGARPVAETISILQDVARALSYAHAHGVVHRDIKPENVLLSGGAAVVTDFGIAKAIDASRTQDGDQPGAPRVPLTGTGAMLGTTAYMSPEQASGDPNVDHRADIYAWGMIAWELLAGRHPFAGKPSLQALIVAQLNEVPKSIASVRGDVPRVLSKLIRRCLEKEPDRRPATSTELLALLDQVSSSGSRVAGSSPAATHSDNGVVARIGIFAAVLLVTFFLSWRLDRNGRGLGRQKSVAIIPFAAAPADTRSAYIGQGIADQVTSELKQIGVRLAGTSSAARFVGKSAQEAGRALGFPLVLDGHVVRLGADSVRITAELTRASDGELLWHDTYAVSANGMAAVQDQIARTIALQLQVRLADDGAERSRGTKDAIAYEFYLRGVYLFGRRGSGIREAIEALERATARDSNFARAWAALAQALTVEPSYEDVRVGAMLPAARAAAAHAIRVAPKLADAHAALGYVDLEALEWSRAEAELDSAIKLDTTEAEPRYRLGIALLAQGKTEDAIPQFRAAVALDPFYFTAKAFLGWSEFLAGNHTEGLEELRRSLDLEPAGSVPLSLLAIGYARAGIRDSAQQFARRLLGSSSHPLSLFFGYAAYALARSGQRDEARALIARLDSLPADAWMRWTSLAVAYAGLADTLKMIDAMAHAAATDDGDLFPLGAAVRLIGELPNGPRVDSILARFDLDPKRFAKPQRVP